MPRLVRHMLTPKALPTVTHHPVSSHDAQLKVWAGRRSGIMGPLRTPHPSDAGLSIRSGAPGHAAAPLRPPRRHPAHAPAPLPCSLSRSPTLTRALEHAPAPSLVAGIVGSLLQHQQGKAAGQCSHAGQTCAQLLAVDHLFLRHAPGMVTAALARATDEAHQDTTLMCMHQPACGASWPSVTDMTASVRYAKLCCRCHILCMHRQPCQASLPSAKPTADHHKLPYAHCPQCQLALHQRPSPAPWP